ncbi:MAG: hypothetical protein WAV28_02380 [Sedimentisphaerales bacterium]
MNIFSELADNGLFSYTLVVGVGSRKWGRLGGIRAQHNALLLAGGTGPRNPRESADILSYYDVKNTLVKCYAMAMIVHSVAYMTFRPKGNSNSRSKYAFEVETIQLGAKQL